MRGCGRVQIQGLKSLFGQLLIEMHWTGRSQGKWDELVGKDDERRVKRVGAKGHGD